MTFKKIYSANLVRVAVLLFLSPCIVLAQDSRAKFLIDSLTKELNVLKTYPELDPYGIEREEIISDFELFQNSQARRVTSQKRSNYNPEMKSNRESLEDQLFGGQSVENDPLYQKNQQAKAALEKANPLGQPTSVPDRVTSLQYEADDYTKHLDGNYSGTSEEMDARVDQAKAQEKFNATLIALGIGLAAYLLYRYNKQIY